MAKQADVIQEAIGAAFASDPDFVGSVLGRQATALHKKCEFHVCLFALVTLFRNPQFGGRTKPALELRGTLESILEREILAMPSVSDQAKQEQEPDGQGGSTDGVDAPEMLKTIKAEVCVNIETVGMHWGGGNG